MIFKNTLLFSFSWYWSIWLNGRDRVIRSIFDFSLFFLLVYFQSAHHSFKACLLYTSDAADEV
ncbi:hypothetical protein KQJ29_15905, partial [Enterococcus sp. S181_ASV_20]|nr:hypothetical protein [Enterococcus sp. S181_ASV_20]